MHGMFLSFQRSSRSENFEANIYDEEFSQKSSFDEEENIHSKERTIDDDLQRKYEAAKKMFDEALIHERTRKSILIRPGIKEFISKINSIADIYILTASSRSRALNVWSLLPDSIKTHIKGIYSSKPNKRGGIYAPSSEWQGRPYVLVDDNESHTSSRNQIKHAIIQNNSENQLLRRLRKMYKNKEYIDIDDFHVVVPSFELILLPHLNYNSEVIENLDLKILDKGVDFDSIFSDILKKLEKQTTNND